MINALSRSGIKLGKNVTILKGAIIECTGVLSKLGEGLTIGNNVTIGHSVTLHGCTINNFVLVGMRAVILDHAEIGEECMIGAGALVTQGTKIPPRSMVLGSPGKVVRPLRDEEIAFLHQSAQNYKDYTKMYRQSGFPEVKKL